MRKAGFEVWRDDRWDKPQVGDKINGLGVAREVTDGHWCFIEGQEYVWIISPACMRGYILTETHFRA